MDHPMMKEIDIVKPNMSHIFERDKAINLLLEEATRLTNKCRDSIITPEDLDRLDNAVLACTKVISA